MKARGRTRSGSGAVLLASLMLLLLCVPRTACRLVPSLLLLDEADQVIAELTAQE